MIQREYTLEDAADFHFQPCYKEPLECGGCGKEVTELYPCYWDQSLKVGACCLIHSDEAAEYAEPLCAAVTAIAAGARGAEEFTQLLRSHIAECVECGSTRKTVVEDRLLVNPQAVCCDGKAA